jgi:hypothetical protein
MSTELHPHLVALGDSLEHAITDQLGREQVTRRGRRRHSRKIAVATVAGGLMLVGVGSAAAYSLLSPATVAQGMPGSSAIFTGTDPTCTTSDHVVFQCTLERTPTVGFVPSYTGTKESFADGNNDVAGGCIGQDTLGLRWTCYAGQRAVQEGIIGSDYLGQHQNGPASG